MPPEAGKPIYHTYLSGMAFPEFWTDVLYCLISIGRLLKFSPVFQVSSVRRLV